jgi:hypothetical protein
MDFLKNEHVFGGDCECNLSSVISDMVSCGDVDKISFNNMLDALNLGDDINCRLLNCLDGWCETVDNVANN